jgi:hypothetical protein
VEPQVLSSISRDFDRGSPMKPTAENPEDEQSDDEFDLQYAADLRAAIAEASGLGGPSGAADPYSSNEPSP